MQAKNDWGKKIKTRVAFVTNENYTKCNFQGPSGKCQWNTATPALQVLSAVATPAGAVRCYGDRRDSKAENIYHVVLYRKTLAE